MKRLALLMLALPAMASTQENRPVPPGWADDPPALGSLVEFAQRESTLRTAVLRYARDVEALHRRFPVEYSPARIERLRRLAEGWKQRLASLDFDSLNFEGEIDYIALRNRIDHDLERLKLEDQRAAQLKPLLPFFDDIRLLQEQRFDRQRVDPKAAAATLDKLTRQAKELTASLDEPSPGAAGAGARPGARTRVPGGAVAIRAQAQLEALRETLKDWHTFYDGYDPNYSWWARRPYGEADAALAEYAKAIRARLLGIKADGKAPILGDPVLADGLRSDLAVEMIPYSPQELIAIGEQELKWIDEQLRATARRMGHGDDWKAALEQTKSLAPPPGEAPWAIYDIANYSEDFIARQHSVTLAPLAREIWRLEMQTPERQLINPFFTGGEVTRLSYPTDTMSYEDRLMSQRGNTPHFNFPTVQHELVPGHHYQGWMNERFNSHRDLAFDTPFWREGWALYWELQLWDANFPRNDPDRMGMLFWRAHRAARIIFSMNFQLGNWSAQQCVDFLVERVGHERANAEAEVRRSAQAAPPMYQAAYLLGGLQLRALYKELVASGKMTAIDFHDAVLLGGPMPIELVRARLLGKPIGRDYRSQWRFYGDIGKR
jgi:hypothetical protein